MSEPSGVDETGLAAGGNAGARHAMQLLTNELELALVLAGCPTVTTLDRAWLLAADPPLELCRWKNTSATARDVCGRARAPEEPGRVTSLVWATASADKLPLTVDRPLA